MFLQSTGYGIGSGEHSVHCVHIFGQFVGENRILYIYSLQQNGQEYVHNVHKNTQPRELAILLERIIVHNALHYQFLWTWLLCASRFLTLLQVPINSHSVRTAEFAKLLNAYIER